MVSAQEKENLTLRRATAAEILPYVARAAAFDTTGGNLDIEAIARHGEAFVLEGQGGPVFGYTLEIDGGEVTITAAAGRSAHDLTEIGLAIIEAQAQGFQSIAFHTRRAGLVRKARRRGYRIAATLEQPRTGFIMRKTIQ